MVGDSPENPFQASRVPATPPPQSQGEEGDATGGLIPYKNPAALTAYYLSIFSLLPCAGFPLGVAAFILGIIGLRRRKANPIIRGSAHAWIGIILGGLCALIWGALMALLCIGAIMNRR